EKNAPRPGPEWRFADMVTGACLLVRRELWQQLGGFDPKYVNGCEDVDFCLRAKAAGFASVVALRSVVLHHVSASPGRKRRDEENAYRLTLRWRTQLVQLGLPAWCRKFIECDLNAATPPLAALSAFRYLAGWSRQAPAFAVAGMQAAIELELSRWEKIVGPLA
ncbi:MAG TPA: glycosyltransferase, partial [Opitutaceae bacterium]|nr:glycosyltransferase [Opitutaceae bacterium]